MYENSTFPVFADVASVHTAWLDHATGSGTWWSGLHRRTFVTAVWSALDDPDPLPPWVPPSHAGRAPSPAGGEPSPIDATLADVAYRLGRHAATATEAWYQKTLAALEVQPPAYVELVALAAMGAAVATFAPALGLPRPSLPEARDGEPTREAPETEAALLNWVPVTPPADKRAAVLQAFSAVPVEFAMLWRFGAAQYMPPEEMVHMDWKRGALHRSQMELVAARTSLLRQCFY